MSLRVLSSIFRLVPRHYDAHGLVISSLSSGGPTRQHSTQNKKINLKKSSSRQWLIRQLNDKYVKLARVEQWRCRSAFKLLEIQEKCDILKPGMGVIDCGAAPGSWSQVAARLVRATGKIGETDAGFVISIDRDSFPPVEGCICLKGADINATKTHAKVAEILAGKKVDVLLSDMAPNATGHKEMDHERIIELNLELLNIATHVLKESGSLVCKIWEGSRTRHFQSVLQTVFEETRTIKPDASRANSAEKFIVALGYSNPKLDVLKR